MTNLQKTEIKNSIPMYCKIKGLTDSELARNIGISGSTLSNMKHDKWESISDMKWKVVWNVCNPEILIGLLQTYDCKSVFEALERAKKESLMIGVMGDTGLGKSTSCKAFALRENVFYYEYDFGTGPKVFLRALLKTLYVSFDGTISAMQERVVSELNMLDAPLIIIDEASKLNDKMIMLLHSIRNKTLNNCGIALVGMPYFKNNLIKQIRKGTLGYSEFFRRINLFHELRGLDADEIVFILERNGITDKDTQKEFRKFTRFGDLMNEIMLHKSVND